MSLVAAASTRRSTAPTCRATPTLQTWRKASSRCTLLPCSFCRRPFLYSRSNPLRALCMPSCTLTRLKDSSTLAQRKSTRLSPTPPTATAFTNIGSRACKRRPCSRCWPSFARLSSAWMPASRPSSTCPVRPKCAPSCSGCRACPTRAITLQRRQAAPTARRNGYCGTPPFAKGGSRVHQ